MATNKDLPRRAVGSQIGGHMEEALKSRGLRYYEMTGSAKDAVAPILAQEKK